MDCTVRRNEAVAMNGASPGAIGPAIVQQHPRQIRPLLDAHVLPGEVHVEFKTSDMIDAKGPSPATRRGPSISAFAALVSWLA